MSKCKHYEGALAKQCKLGILYASVDPCPDKPGRLTRLPCIDPDLAPLIGTRGQCEKYEGYTKEELAQREKVLLEALDRMDKLQSIIEKVKKEHKRKAWQGTVECPVCKGKLHLSHAAINGHVWGRCETTDCVRWME